MAYERDPDRAIRGVGAIASRDAGNAERHAMRVAQGRATRARDRQMSQMTYGPRGGMGAINVRNTNDGPPVAADDTSPPFVQPTTSPPFVQPTKTYGGAGGTPLPTYPNPFPEQLKTPPIVVVVDPGPPTCRSPQVMGPKGCYLPPTTTTGGGKTVVVVSGGGQGAGITTGGSKTSPNWDDPIWQTPPPPLPDPGSDAVSDSTRNWLLLGAAGLAAYLVLRKGGK